jgi:hypothetical protein
VALPEPRIDPRPRWQRIAWLTLLALALSTFAWWPAITAYPKAQAGDGPVFHKMLETAKWSVLRYHEFPGWNPYECGGVALWDNPQSIVGAPLAWLTLIWSTTRTIEVWYVVHSAAGFLGMWALLRADLKLSRIACLVGSAMWAFSGFHVNHSVGGHAAFVPFEYFPLALYLWRKAETHQNSAIALGALLALMLYEGAVYPLPHLALVLGIEGLLRARSPGRILGMLKAGAIVGVVAVGLSAARLFPVVHQLRAHNRSLADEHDRVLWTTLKDVFFAHTHDRKVPGQEYVWPEYGAFFGPFLFGIAVLGIVAEGATHVWLAVLLVISFALMMGHWASWAPWHLLRGHVFPFKQMRVPSRFVVVVTLCLSAYAAIAIDRFPRLLRRIPRVKNLVRPGGVRSLLIVLSLIGLGDVFGVGIAWIPNKFNGHVPDRVKPSRHLYLGGKGLAEMIDQPMQNRGRIKCWDEWGFGWGAPLWEGDVPQARATDEQVATVKNVTRTPNTFTLDVDAKKPTRILFNTPYDDNWHTDVGHTVRIKKQLAVDVPAGSEPMRVKYRPYGLNAGIFLTMTSLVVLTAWLVWEALQRRAEMAGGEPVKEERTTPEAEP